MAAVSRCCVRMARSFPARLSRAVVCLRHSRQSWTATTTSGSRNLAMSESPIAHLCGARTENCPPGLRTGDQISPPGGYVGGGAAKVDRFGDQSGRRRLGDERTGTSRTVVSLTPARTKRFPRVAAATASRSSTEWLSRSARRRSVRLGSHDARVAGGPKNSVAR